MIPVFGTCIEIRNVFKNAKDVLLIWHTAGIYIIPSSSSFNYVCQMSKTIVRIKENLMNYKQT